MSASPVARQLVTQAIPVSRRVVVNHESELPNDLSSTPGGSIFSTTPGGTRVYYDKSSLLALRNSPLSRTPPANLPAIRGVTIPDDRPQAVIDEEASNYVDCDKDATAGGAPRRPGEDPTEDKEASSPKDNKDDDDQFQLEL